MNNIETMKLALEALEYLDVTAENYVDDRISYAAITALRQAIEQAQQVEPVAWLNPYGGVVQKRMDGHERTCYTIPLYTSPPPRQWVKLTKKEFQEAVEGLEDLEDCWVAIEAKLRIKNDLHR